MTLLVPAKAQSSLLGLIRRKVCPEVTPSQCGPPVDSGGLDHTGALLRSAGMWPRVTQWQTA